MTYKYFETYKYFDPRSGRQKSRSPSGLIRIVLLFTLWGPGFRAFQAGRSGPVAPGGAVPYKYFEDRVLCRAPYKYFEPYKTFEPTTTSAEVFVSLPSRRSQGVSRG